jgi:hypothetical protein
VLKFYKENPEILAYITAPKGLRSGNYHRHGHQISALQKLGTISAIDIDAYAKYLL